VFDGEIDQDLRVRYAFTSNDALSAVSLVKQAGKHWVHSGRIVFDYSNTARMADPDGRRNKYVNEGF
jgi:hypothetical protein